MKRLLLLMLSALFVFAAAACTEDVPEEHLDINDPQEGIFTTADLIAFFENGDANSVRLGASIDLGDALLSLSNERGPITVYGEGNTITGNGDCVIRLENGAALQLMDVEIVAGRSGIGCLGNAALSGNVTITSVAHGIFGEGDITIGENSVFRLASNVGTGLSAKGLTLLKGSSLDATGSLGGLNIRGDELRLGEGVTVSAETKENYNALKCEGTLALEEGAKLSVINGGEYHGAEIHDLSVEGLATLEAVGGAKGVGVFLFEQEADVYLIGSCTPELRFEVGDGSITFVADASEIPEPEETPEDSEETEEPTEE
ncbi:MAG: hypothetical protein E7330_07515 [Clostridiales bacterium]|nr:hypothetical protein [Clostridiales bacterium]